MLTVDRGQIPVKVALAHARSPGMLRFSAGCQADQKEGFRIVGFSVPRRPIFRPAVRLVCD
jgi:hypothetical protein